LSIFSNPEEGEANFFSIGEFGEILTEVGQVSKHDV